MAIEQDSGSKPTTEKSKSFRYLVVVFTLIGAGGVLAGIIHVLGILSSGFTIMRLADAIFNIVLGVLVLLCSRVLKNGRSLVILLYGGTVLLSIGYSFAVGRGFNFVMAAIGLIFIWQLTSLKLKGELA